MSVLSMRKIAMLLTLFATMAQAQEVPQTLTLSPYTASSSITAITGQMNLVISCGNGSVSISMKTGKVTLKDCTEDEGARRFWDAIERMYPGQIPH